ncbi:MAG: sulfite exporter TauE/SafE family protein, partial [Opitutaceae bacterium]|nr:sulfite exporter TauE/SafE family protein [Opitutaceae bacterium]
MAHSAETRAAAQREFWTRVLPLALAVWAFGIAASYLQHGFLIGGERGVPLAGPDCHAALWHLLLLGFVAGYTMALVGGATGLVALPYSMSVLGFVTTNVSPTVQWETFLNPFGALIGFRRSGQLNGNFALPLCVGAALGALIGPFIRVQWLPDPVPFKAAVGVALMFVGVQMLYGVFQPRRAAAAAGVIAHFVAEPTRTRTVSKSWSHLTIAYGDGDRRMSVPGLVLLGAGVGVIGTMLGVGGGFLLVPILAEFYRLPMRVI